MDDQTRIEELQIRMDSLETSLEIVTQRLTELMAQMSSQIDRIEERLLVIENKRQRKNKQS